MDMALSFMPRLQVFTAVLAEPTAQSFRQLVAGWVFAAGCSEVLMRAGNG